MKNQTIDGVPRELIEKAMLACFEAGFGIPHAELRALLDAPAKAEFSIPDCPDCACVQDGQCLCIPSKPAAQPQGEPVAEIVSKYGDPEAFGERELITLKDISKFPYGTKLYAEQPASVAVVLPERMKEPDWDDFKPDSQAHEAACEGAKKFNECLDEVTRLNAK